MRTPVQTPSPGSYILAHKGDLLTFTVSVPASAQGTTWLRTNLSNGRLRLNEIVDRVERQQPVTANDWCDTEMQQIDDGVFAVTVPLLEVGRFEAKTMFLPQGSNEPVWPEGTNVVIKVEPAEYYCANTFYTAFVRQFGPNKVRWTTSQADGESIRSLDKDGYTVIPRSGTFRDLIEELDFIINYDIKYRMGQDAAGSGDADNEAEEEP